MKTAFVLGWSIPTFAALDLSLLLESPWLIALTATALTAFALNYPVVFRFLKAVFAKLATPAVPITPPPVASTTDDAIRAYIALACCKQCKCEPAQKALAEIWSHLRPGGDA